MVQIFTCATCGGPMFVSGPAQPARCPNCAGGNSAAGGPGKTPLVATLVPQVDPQEAELAAEDARWRKERIRYCRRDKFGLYPAPSPGMGMFGALCACLPGGYFLFRGTSQFESPSGQWYFCIAGALFILGGVFNACREAYNWANYSLAEGDYQARRQAIVAKYQAAKSTL